MPTIVIEADLFTWRYVKSQVRYKVSEEELDMLFQYLEPEDNPRCVTAREFMEYLDGRGQLAHVVKLAGTEAQIELVKSKLALAAYDDGIKCSVLHETEVSRKVVDHVQYDRAYVKWP